MSTSPSVAPTTIQHDALPVIDTAALAPRQLSLDNGSATTPSTDVLRREGSRDGPGGCLICGKDVSSTRARYCTRAHQQYAYRLRQHTATADLTSARNALQRRKALVAHTIYECGGCGERFLGERRCSECNLFARAVGLGGSCPECDAAVLVDDLLGEG